MNDNSANYLERTRNGTSFAGSDMKIFAALTLASALRMYAKTGMKPNANYTPTRMLAAASAITGNTYKRGEYERAAGQLTDIADDLKAKPRVEAG